MILFTFLFLHFADRPFLFFSCVKVRTETSPEDVGGMHAAEGILTARGGMTSHAAVVARGWGKCCVCGCFDIHISDAQKVNFVFNNGRTLKNLCHQKLTLFCNF